MSSSSPSSDKENQIDLLPVSPEIFKYNSKTVITSKTSAKSYRHFGIFPEANGEESPGTPVTFIFVSVNKNENGVPLNVIQDQITTVFRTSYVNGVILKAKEKSATYPVIYFTERMSSNVNEKQYAIDGCVSHNGIYRDVRVIKPISEPSESTVTPQKWRTYILLGFKRPQNCFNQTMIDTWKDWTSARYIYINLPDEMGLTQITLYQKDNMHFDDNVNVFSHLVVVECCTVNTEQKHRALLDFVQRLRVERISGYISLYDVAAEY